MNEIFASLLCELPLLMERLRASPALCAHEISRLPHPGVYCFFEDGQALYVGRTKNFRKRHTNHCGRASGENTAAFAFILARGDGRITATYGKVGSRKDLMRDSAFSSEFSRSERTYS